MEMRIAIGYWYARICLTNCIVKPRDIAACRISRALDAKSQSVCSLENIRHDLCGPFLRDSISPGYRRKCRKEKSIAKQMQRTLDATGKAQFQSDNHKPRREELNRSEAPLQIWIARSLHEVEH